jgi:hypothetical protein
MTALLLIAYIIACISAGAIGDALNDTSRKNAGHLLTALETLICLVGATIFGVEPNTLIAYLSVYIGLRIAFFDLIYNITSGRPILSMGSSNLWDRFFSKYPPVGVIFMRVIFLSLAVGLSFKFFNI